MNLYSINFTHYSPQDSKEGIKSLVLAENSEAVFKYVDLNYKHGAWSEEPEFKQEVIENNGEFGLIELDDLYYGATLYGWTLLVENTTTDYSELINAKIVVVCS